MAAMRKRLTTAALAATLLLTAAPAALAQSAGCSQYCDPVGNTGGPSGTGSSPGGSSGSGTSTPTSPSTGSSGSGTTSSGTTSSGTTSSGTTSTTGTTTASSTPAEGTAAAPGELPRTGGDPMLIAIFGVAMLLMGAGMRLVVPQRD
jgi:hypothetical protein